MQAILIFKFSHYSVTKKDENTSEFGHITLIHFTDKHGNYNRKETKALNVFCYLTHINIYVSILS